MSAPEAMSRGSAWSDRILVRLNLVLDAAGTRAMVTIDNGSSGEEFWAERTSAGWILHGLGSRVN